MNDPHGLGPLLSRARQGDRAALNALLAHLRPYLHLLVRVRLGPDLGNSDIVQDALLRIHEWFGRFRGETVPQLLAWVKPIVHTAVARGRRHPSAVALPADSELLAGLRPARDRGPPEQCVEREEAADRAEQVVRLTAALDRLPEHKRELVQLRFFHGLAFAEIGRRMGKSEGACRVLCLRALEQLRAMLEVTS